MNTSKLRALLSWTSGHKEVCIMDDEGKIHPIENVIQGENRIILATSINNNKTEENENEIKNPDLEIK